MDKFDNGLYGHYIEFSHLVDLMLKVGVMIRSYLFIGLYKSLRLLLEQCTMLWTKVWTEPIWRVDSKKGKTGNYIKNIYPFDRPTYFLTSSDHAQGYIDNYVRKNNSGRGRLYFYIKQFVPVKEHPLGPVRLLDMGKADTIRALLDVSEVEDAEAIKTSFQIQADNSVKRYSEPETKHIDDIALRAICRYCDAQLFEGYYIDAPGLHPEIGLCPQAFRRFQFVDQIERIEAPRVAGRKRTRNNNNNKGRRTVKRYRYNSNSNSNSNNLMSPPPLQRRLAL